MCDCAILVHVVALMCIKVDFVSLIYVSSAFALSHSVNRNDPSFQENFVTGIVNVVFWPFWKRLMQLFLKTKKKKTKCAWPTNTLMCVTWKHQCRYVPSLFMSIKDTKSLYGKIACVTQLTFSTKAYINVISIWQLWLILPALRTSFQCSHMSNHT